MLTRKVDKMTVVQNGKTHLGVLSETARDKMNEKMGATVLHMHKIEADKKASNAGFSEEIKAARKRIKALADALNENDISWLNGVFYDEEIEDFMRL